MPAFVARYAEAFADVVTDAKLDAAAIDRQFSDFLATWEGSAELRTFFENPAIPAPQKIVILDKLNAKLGMQKELRNLIAVLSNNDRIGNVAEVAAGLSQHSSAAVGNSPRRNRHRARVECRRTQHVWSRNSRNSPAQRLTPASNSTHPFSAAPWSASAPRSTTAACAAVSTA